MALRGGQLQRRGDRVQQIGRGAVVGALLEPADGANRVAGQAREVLLGEGGGAATAAARKTRLLQGDLAAAITQERAQPVGPAVAI